MLSMVYRLYIIILRLNLEHPKKEDSLLSTTIKTQNEGTTSGGILFNPLVEFKDCQDLYRGALMPCSFNMRNR